MRIRPLLAAAMLGALYASALPGMARADDDTESGDRGAFDRDDDRGRDDGGPDRLDPGDDRVFAGDDGGSGGDDRGSGGDDRMSGGDRGGAGEAWYETPFWPDSDFEREEVVAQGLTEAQLAALRQRGFVVLQVRDDASARLRVPRGMRLKRALAEVRALEPARVIADRNHLYRPAAPACPGASCPPLRLIAWPAANCPSRPLLGLIDNGVDLDHVALRGQRIELLTVRGDRRAAAGRDHGTAVASILVGAAGSVAPGLLPQAQLIAVDAFHRRGAATDRMDAFDLAAALRLLTERGAAVVNLSFTGPPNALVARAVQDAQARGVTLVAAAGNDGPRAAPRYPAAYPDVIAVTAVSSDLRVYRRAGRGGHIAFAAPGVGIAVAAAGRPAGVAERSGTSFAAPFVTAAAALVRAAPGAGSADVARLLRASARDLGAPGFDPVFGHGLIQATQLCASAATAAAR